MVTIAAAVVVQSTSMPTAKRLEDSQADCPLTCA